MLLLMFNCLRNWLKKCMWNIIKNSGSYCSLQCHRMMRILWLLDLLLCYKTQWQMLSNVVAMSHLTTNAMLSNALLRLDYGNATWLASRPLCSTVSSPSSTPQLGWSLVFIARSILRMLVPVSTGFECPSASSSNWRSSYTELSTALHLSTYPTNYGTLPISRRDTLAGCARRPPVFLTSADRGLLLSLSAIAHLLLLARVSGTVYLLTSSLLHHLQHSVRNWNILISAIIPRRCSVTASP